jgi:hypothetical protein
MAVGLVLSGGAPVLTFMAGALVALDERDVKFDVISTSGAGMRRPSVRGARGRRRQAPGGPQEHRLHGRIG